MSDKKNKILLDLFKGAVLVVFFAVFIHLNTSGLASLKHLFGSLVIAVVALIPALKFSKESRKEWKNLIYILTTLAAGFWIFNFFRYLGFVRWPLARPANLEAYVWLLYYHFILSVTVLSPIFTMRYFLKINDKVSFGKWWSGKGTKTGKAGLIISSIIVWVWALFSVKNINFGSTQHVEIFFIICLLKAFLTGATEEMCYRGIIQPVAIARFGVPAGILFQSCFYAVFHMHLGAPFLSRTLFLIGVMVLGLIFGFVTRRTSGIGWAVIIHMAINVVIEWQNIF